MEPLLLIHDSIVHTLELADWLREYQVVSEVHWRDQTQAPSIWMRPDLEKKRETMVIMLTWVQICFSWWKFHLYTNQDQQLFITYI